MEPRETAVRRIKGSCAGAILLLAASSNLAQATAYVFDSAHGQVEFTYQAGFISQSGRFTEIGGVFDFDGKNPGRSSMKAVIRTTSLKANQFENELRGSDFFNVAVFPEIRFASRAL